MRRTLSRRVLCLLTGLVTGLVVAVPLTLAAPAQAGPAAPESIGWTSTGKLNFARERGAGVLLNDGRVLVIGGRDCGSGCTYFASSEIYNPTFGTWSPGPAMSTPRTSFEAVQLGNGKVLVIGGSNGTGSSTTAELYNPATNSFSSAGNFAFAGARDSSFVAVRLPSGKVLVVGGCCSGAPYIKNTIIYNPATNSWSFGPSLSSSRSAPTATLLPNGKVLVAGGLSNAGVTLSSTDLYDPVTNTVTPGPSMFDPRQLGESALMPDGRVLIVGGNNNTGCLKASEVYNPTTNTFVDHRTGLPDRRDETADPVLTNNGSMLTAAGDCSLHNSQLYDGATATWSTTPDTVSARRDHVLLRLRSGFVMAAGGANTSKSQRTAELFEPATLATAYATPNPVVQGVPVTIAGTGFLGGERITLSNNGVVFASTTANGVGAFSVSVPTGGFAPRVYIDRALGSTSGRSSYFYAPVVAG